LDLIITGVHKGENKKPHGNKIKLKLNSVRDNLWGELSLSGN